MRVLVTGAAGNIGTVVCAGLLDRGYEVVGLDLAAEPEGFTGRWFTADCADPDAVSAVFEALEEHGRVDAVVHLASIPHEAALPVILESHVVTTAALLDAMVEHGVTRFLYASSNHAVGRVPRQDLLGVDAPARADTFYGVGKVAAEALLRLYVDRYALDAVAMRIGSFRTQPETRRELSTWLSHDDAVRMVDACLNAPDPGFSVVYGISANTRAWWDLASGRALGYEPQDDAEAFAGRIETTPETENDRAEAGFVGGPFVTDDYFRPALGSAPGPR
jgi:uronate dehydrogenase